MVALGAGRKVIVQKPHRLATCGHAKLLAHHLQQPRLINRAVRPLHATYAVIPFLLQLCEGVGFHGSELAIAWRLCRPRARGRLEYQLDLRSLSIGKRVEWQLHACRRWEVDLSRPRYGIRGALEKAQLGLCVLNGRLELRALNRRGGEGEDPRLLVGFVIEEPHDDRLYLALLLLSHVVGLVDDEQRDVSHLDAAVAQRHIEEFGCHYYHLRLGECGGQARRRAIATATAIMPAADSRCDFAASNTIVRRLERREPTDVI